MEFPLNRAPFCVFSLDSSGMCRSHAATYLDRLAKIFAARPAHASFGVYRINKLVTVAVLRTRNAARPTNFVRSTDS